MENGSTFVYRRALRIRQHQDTHLQFDGSPRFLVNVLLPLSLLSLSLSLSFSPTLFHLVHHYLRVLENCTRVRIVRTRAQLCHWSLSSVSVEYPIERVEVGTCNTVNHDSLCGPMCVDVTLCVVYTFLKFESSISLFFFFFFFFWQQILLGCIFLSRTFKTVSLEIYIYIWPRVLKDRTFVVNLIGLASD